MAGEGARGPGAKPLRLFVAVDVAAEAERALEAAVAPLRASLPQARWVPRENRHVTVKFLGWTDPGAVEAVRDAIAGVAAAHAPVRTALTGLGSFPSASRTRVLWVGLDDRSGRLARLAEALDGALGDGFRAEERPFTAHLTVARIDPPARLEPSPFGTPLDAPAFRIDRLVLYRSHLGRPAPRYEVVAAFPLGGHPPPA
jgi:2'-5' RNA ligase